MDLTLPVKMQPSVAQVIWTLFWGSHVPTLECFKEKGATVNSVKCNEMLWNWRNKMLRNGGVRFCTIV